MKYREPKMQSQQWIKVVPDFKDDEIHSIFRSTDFKGTRPVTGSDSAERYSQRVPRILDIENLETANLDVEMVGRARFNTA